MTQQEKIELIERERDAWQCDADDHKRRGCTAHYEHEQAMADALTEAMGVLHKYTKLKTACEALVWDSSPFEADKVLCDVGDIRRLIVSGVDA